MAIYPDANKLKNILENPYQLGRAAQIPLGFWETPEFLWVSAYSAPEYEVSVHPTLCDTPLVMKCRLLRSELDHIFELYRHLSLPFVVIQINHDHAFVVWHISCANTESELAFASDFAIPVALAELSDRLITLVLFSVRELRVNEWFFCCWLDSLTFSMND